MVWSYLPLWAKSSHLNKNLHDWEFCIREEDFPLQILQKNQIQLSTAHHNINVFDEISLESSLSGSLRVIQKVLVYKIM